MKIKRQFKNQYHKNSYLAGYRAGLAAAIHCQTGNISPSGNDRAYLAAFHRKYVNLGWCDGCNAYYMTRQEAEEAYGVSSCT